MFIPLLSKSAFLCTQATNHTNIHSGSPPMHVHAWNPIPDPACLTGWAVLCCLRCLHCVVFIGLPVVPGKRWLSCVWHFNFLKQTLSREFVDSSFSAGQRRYGCRIHIWKAQPESTTQVSHHHLSLVNRAKQFDSSLSGAKRTFPESQIISGIVICVFTSLLLRLLSPSIPATAQAFELTLKCVTRPNISRRPTDQGVEFIHSFVGPPGHVL